jgi:hypothetical protein
LISSPVRSKAAGLLFASSQRIENLIRATGFLENNSREIIFLRSMVQAFFLGAACSLFFARR